MWRPRWARARPRSSSCTRSWPSDHRRRSGLRDGRDAGRRGRRQRGARGHDVLVLQPELPGAVRRRSRALPPPVRSRRPPGPGVGPGHADLHVPDAPGGAPDRARELPQVRHGARAARGHRRRGPEPRARGHDPALLGEPGPRPCRCSRSRWARCSRRGCCAALGPTGWLWSQLVLATPVVLWGGWPFFVRGWQSLVTRNLNMFTLIALGTGAAFGYSVFAVLFPDALPHAMRHGGVPPVYFEAAAVITTLVLLGQVLELRARSATSGAIRALLGLQPRTARRLREDGREEDVPLEHVAVGRPAAGAAGRARAGGRRGAGRPERGGRVHGHRRADPGGEGAGQPRDRRHRQRHRRLRHARGAGRRRHAAGPDRSHGRRGAAQPRAHPAPGRPGLRLVRPGGGGGGRADRAGVGTLRPGAAPGLRARQRGRGADHRVPVRARSGDADVDHGRRPAAAPRRAC